MVSKIKNLINFVKEAKEELRKVTWPDRDEVTSFTIVVVITVIIISIFLWFVDTALMKLIQIVVG